MDSPEVESKNGPSAVLLESHYLPSLEYMVLLFRSNALILHDQENYQKQSYRNRSYILGPNKVQLLTVPVNKRAGNRKIGDITIDYSSNWQKEHLATLQSAYGKAPFYEYYYEYFRDILQEKPRFLLQLNNKMLTLCLSLLNSDIIISHLSDSTLNLSTTETGYYGFINRKMPFNNRNIYKPVQYQQLFGSDFVPNLSIIDLLFCKGPEAGEIIRNSATGHALKGMN